MKKKKLIHSFHFIFTVVTNPNNGNINMKNLNITQYLALQS